MSTAPKYRRVLLKVSGEALMGSGNFGIDIDVVDRIARDVKEAHTCGSEICMVVGGGNIFRGLAGSAKGIDRSTADKDKLAALAKQLAMHVAAAAPLALTQAHMSKDVVDREYAIQKDLALQSGKPEAVVEKMMEGRMRKYYEETVLMQQTFVIDGETQIAKLIEKASKDLGAPVEIEGFVRFQVGEGIEKVQGDFADEVAQMAGGR